MAGELGDRGSSDMATASELKIETILSVVGRRSIVDKSSAYGAKGPGFQHRWRQRVY